MVYLKLRFYPDFGSDQTIFRVWWSHIADFGFWSENIQSIIQSIKSMIYNSILSYYR